MLVPLGLIDELVPSMTGPRLRCAAGALCEESDSGLSSAAADLRLPLGDPIPDAWNESITVVSAGPQRLRPPLPRPSPYLFAAFFDTLFLLLGLTSENEGYEMEDPACGSPL